MTIDISSNRVYIFYSRKSLLYKFHKEVQRDLISLNLNLFIIV